MRIALFIDEDDVNAIHFYLENKYNGEVTMSQVEAYLDEVVKQKVKEIRDADRDTGKTVQDNAGRCEA